MPTPNDTRIMQCPKFYRCSAPVCPLDERMHDCKRLPGETTCRLPKEERMEFGADLPWLGLWPKELAKHREWERADAANRAKRLSGLRVGAS